MKDILFICRNQVFFYFSKYIKAGLWKILRFQAFSSKFYQLLIIYQISSTFGDVFLPWSSSKNMTFAHKRAGLSLRISISLKKFEMSY